jgi:hypothetical protein
MHLKIILNTINELNELNTGRTPSFSVADIGRPIRSNEFMGSAVSVP